MESPLYLDTARLGLMSPRVGEAMYALARLAGREGLSARFDGLLREGTAVWPAALRSRYAGLADWRGVGDLKQALGDLAGLGAGQTVLLASRSSALMKLAGRLLCRRCRRVLVTDLEWPGYLALLERECQRVAAEVVRVPVRAAVFSDQVSAAEVCARVAAQYRVQDCDGLFLSAVSYQGVRLPAAGICAAVERTRTPRFIVVDGAQALGHAPTDLALGYCDFFLAGTHKWLGAHHPLGLGLCARRRSQRFVRAALSEMASSGELDDPLLSFTAQLEEGTAKPFAETLGLTCLFAARAAAADFRAGEAARPVFPAVTANAEVLAGALARTGWQALLAHPSVRSGILLLRAEAPETREAGAEALRARFLESGVALTSYPGGVVRVSMPKRPWRGRQLALVRHALRRCA